MLKVGLLNRTPWTTGYPYLPCSVYPLFRSRSTRLRGWHVSVSLCKSSVLKYQRPLHSAFFAVHNLYNYEKETNKCVSRYANLLHCGRLKFPTHFCHLLRPSSFTQSNTNNFISILCFNSSFGGLGVSVLASGTRVHGFKPGRSRRIFRAKKDSARPPSEGK